MSLHIGIIDVNLAHLHVCTRQFEWQKEGESASYKKSVNSHSVRPPFRS
jgi:hypothetical protein